MYERRASIYYAAFPAWFVVAVALPLLAPRIAVAQLARGVMFASGVLGFVAMAQFEYWHVIRYIRQNRPDLEAEYVGRYPFWNGCSWRLFGLVSDDRVQEDSGLLASARAYQALLVVSIVAVVAAGVAGF